MPLPWWRRPPERGSPKSSVKARGPCTGQTQEPEPRIGTGPRSTGGTPPRDARPEAVRRAAAFRAATRASAGWASVGGLVAADAPGGSPIPGATTTTADARGRPTGRRG